MNIEGQLAIELRRNGSALASVAINSSRPLQAVRVFEGMQPAEVLQRLPILYSICGTAQAQAAQIALDRAQSRTSGRSIECARELLVLLETAREHAWRVFIDWPEFLGEKALASLAAPLTTLVPRARIALFADATAFGPEARLHVIENAMIELIDSLERMLELHVFDRPLYNWRKIDDMDELDRWANDATTVPARLLRMVMGKGWSGLGRSQMSFLPDIPDAHFETRLSAHDAHAFIAAPDWNGESCETTPLARQHRHPLIQAVVRQAGNGILARFLAQLTELASMPDRLRALFDELLSTSPHNVTNDAGASNGTGIGQVEAARGRLVHRVELHNGRVSRYQILAPTEWNFHPRGAAARSLGALTIDDTALRQQAAMLISAVDPCVGYALTVQ
jgi:coenzyme F420-reducing hydrogenase alpha subunit